MSIQESGQEEESDFLNRYVSALIAIKTRALQSVTVLILANPQYIFVKVMNTKLTLSSKTLKTFSGSLSVVIHVCKMWSLIQ